MNIMHKIGILIAVGLALGYAIKAGIPQMSGTWRGLGKTGTTNGLTYHDIGGNGAASFSQIKAYEKRLGI